MAKRKQSSSSSLAFHPSFHPPTAAQRRDALGSFPGAEHTVHSRQSMLDGYRNGCSTTATTPTALSDLDKSSLYKPIGPSETNHGIPKPHNSLDWLANVPEEGQTFDEYICFLTSRSGRIRPIANPACNEIVLLPIVSLSSSSSSSSAAGAPHWPGPPLEPLVALTRAFFDRPVRLLDPAKLSGYSEKQPNQSKSGCTFDMRFPMLLDENDDATPQQEAQPTNRYTAAYKISGRQHIPTQRVQYKVDSLLKVLAAQREATFDKSFCVMGLTIEDLYQGNSDLFVSGMAAGGSKVAVFSFGRYHPYLKMHPGRWFDYGFGTRPDSYSYYSTDEDDEDGGSKAKKKKNADGSFSSNTPLSKVPLDFESSMASAQSEFWRRSGKLLVHELGHLYGLDHCIFNRCNMMGTAHLVEDFDAPFHLCGVCLRKLQWRLGFGVIHRYEALAIAFRAMRLTKEAAWARRQVVGLKQIELKKAKKKTKKNMA